MGAKDGDRIGWRVDRELAPGRGFAPISVIPGRLGVTRMQTFNADVRSRSSEVIAAQMCAAGAQVAYELRISPPGTSTMLPLFLAPQVPDRGQEVPARTFTRTRFNHSLICVFGSISSEGGAEQWKLFACLQSPEAFGSLLHQPQPSSAMYR